jgi:hypothetical protein
LLGALQPHLLLLLLLLLLQQRLLRRHWHASAAASVQAPGAAAAPAADAAAGITHWQQQQQQQVEVEVPTVGAEGDEWACDAGEFDMGAGRGADGFDCDITGYEETFSAGRSMLGAFFANAIGVEY